jgi:sec-independent protein translocase protein TatC
MSGGDESADSGREASDAPTPTDGDPSSWGTESAVRHVGDDGNDGDDVGEISYPDPDERAVQRAIEQVEGREDAMDRPEPDSDGGGAAAAATAAGREMSDGGTMTDTGTATGAGTGTGTGIEPGDPMVDEYEGPPDDEEMPLADHIEEMVRRLLVVVVVMSAVSVVVLPFSDELINFIWYSILSSANATTVEFADTPGLAGQYHLLPAPGSGYSNILRVNLAQPKVYNPVALVLARLKTATLAGFVVALPVFVYETYLFMRPGLYPQERRYYLAAVPTSLVLAAIGVAFAFFLVLPALFIYFLYYSQDAALIAFGLTDTYGLMLLLMGFFAVVFQIPLFIMLAIMMGVTSRRWLVERRLYFWGAFLGIAFLFSPDPTGMAPIIVAATMVALFEGTLLLLKWTGRGDSGRVGPTA